MERHKAHSSRFTAIARTAIAGIGILILLGNVDRGAAQLRSYFCATAGDAPGIWPCVLLAGCRAMQAYMFHHHGVLGWLLEMLLSLWPLLPAGGAI
jgi:hypothetical protein